MIHTYKIYSYHKFVALIQEGKIKKLNNNYLKITLNNKKIETKTLGDICDILNGYAFKSSDYNVNANDEYNIITIKNIMKNINVINCDKIQKHEKYSKY